MRKIKLLAIFLVFAYGCSTQRTVGSQHDNQYNRSQKVLYSNSTEKAQPQVPVEKVPDYRYEKEEDRLVNIEQAPVNVASQFVTFTKAETEHVRLAGINPLPASGELMLNLDKLSEFFCYPYTGKMISAYGMRGSSMHTGMDIKAVPNDTIRAAFSGVVRMSKNYSGYGNTVVIRHSAGFETVYSHNSKNLVSPNNVVRAGQPISLAGRTGRATTEHLHFEVRAGGDHIDPAMMLDYEHHKLRSGMLYLKKADGKLLAFTSKSDSDRYIADKSTSTPSTAISSPDFHIVAKGDTLFAISRKYVIPVDRLCTLNSIPRDGVLSLGQKIKVK